MMNLAFKFRLYPNKKQREYFKNNFDACRVDIADGRATKVFIPNDLSQSLVGSGLTGEMLGVAQKPEAMSTRQEYRKAVVDAGAKKAMSADACFSNPDSGKSVLKSGATNARLGSEMKQKTLH